MKTYELTYIISPEISFEEAETKAKEIGSLISDKKGVILRQSIPLAKTFSYPIEKSASGFWGIFEFQLEPEKLEELKSILSKDEKIVRQMVVVKETEKIKKRRRTKQTAINISMMPEEKLSEEKSTTSEVKQKVELKDIEQTLDEILGQ